MKEKSLVVHYQISGKRDKQEIICAIKRKANKVFEVLEGVSFLTQTFHMLDHVVEDVAWYGGISLVDVSDFKNFNYIDIKHIRMMVIRKRGTNILCFSYNIADERIYATNINKTSGVSRAGTKILLGQFFDGNCLIDYVSTDGEKLYRLTFSKQL